MSKSEIEKFTVEDFERDLEWLFGIKHVSYVLWFNLKNDFRKYHYFLLNNFQKQNDLAKTKPKTNSGKMSTVSWSEVCRLI